MRFAEVILRVGSTMVGWLMVYAHCVLLAVTPVAECAPQDAQLWRATLFMALPSAICIFFMLIGLHLRDIVRWLALPLLALVPLAFMAVVPYLWGSTVDGAHVCHVRSPDYPAAPSALWHRLWAPTQVVIIIGIAWAASQYWWPRKVSTIDGP